MPPGTRRARSCKRRHLRGRRARRRRRRVEGQGLRRRHEASRVRRSARQPRHPAKHRSPGSIGACATPAACSRACGWPASMGNARVTVLNLEIVQADAERNLLFVRGAVPGPNGGLVMVRAAVKAPRAGGGCLMATVDVLDASGKKVGDARAARRRCSRRRQRPADAPGGRGRRSPACAPARTRRRPAARSAAAARSRGARRAPAVPGRARSARRNGWAAASRTGRTRTSTRCA